MFPFLTFLCRNFSLSEITVNEGGLIKQKRLPDKMCDLASRAALNGRYYLKDFTTTTVTLLPEETIQVRRLFLSNEKVHQSVVLFHFMPVSRLRVILSVFQIRPATNMFLKFRLETANQVFFLKLFSI